MCVYIFSGDMKASMVVPPTMVVFKPVATSRPVQ